MTDAGVGIYAYAVVGAGERLPLDEQPDVEVVSQGGLSAIVSRVSLEEFGAEALKRNLEDLEWLERTARAHQAVVDRALTATDALVPLRLCTIFTDEAHVREMLDREGEVLEEALARLRGHAEWSVKVLADPTALQRAARERSSAAAGVGAETSPGRAYLARRKLDRVVRDEARALAEAAVEEIHARLCEQATAATVLPPQRREVSGRAGEMLLNGAYLVPRARASEFGALVAELAAGRRELGLEVELTGPWAPYNFVVADREAVP